NNMKIGVDWVFKSRRRRERRGAGNVIITWPFAQRPAIILARLNLIDLLPHAASYIRYERNIRTGLKGEAEGIAESVGVHLTARASSGGRRSRAAVPRVGSRVVWI